MEEERGRKKWYGFILTGNSNGYIHIFGSPNSAALLPEVWSNFSPILSASQDMSISGFAAAIFDLLLPVTPHGIGNSGADLGTEIYGCQRLNFDAI
jgi:hypothetical protein